MHRFYLGFSLCSDVTEPPIKAVEITIGTVGAGSACNVTEPSIKAVEITIGTVGRRLSLQRYRAAN